MHKEQEQRIGAAIKEERAELARTANKQSVSRIEPCNINVKLTLTLSLCQKAAAPHGKCPCAGGRAMSKPAR
eukprot:568339-Prymnesium_polylepis.1